ncbi:MAG: protein kinase [Phycisphaerae bacterium]|nr:protein kinase [Gemmatimonadaceae bacterium]
MANTASFGERIIQALTTPPPRFPGGAYEVDGILGEGGMAIVYRARDMRRPRAVAIKVLRAEIAQLIGTTRFLREIAMTAAFSHPNILPLLDSGEITDDLGRVMPFYVMPLVEGETLHERMVRSGRLPVGDILRITREILEALQYAHSKGVIHRDIKPANILLSNGHAVVADFGVARPVALRNAIDRGEPDVTLVGEIVGTPTYMAPEQAHGNRVVDARADLFSVGCVMYEMTVGVRPFDTPIPQLTHSRKMQGIYLPTNNHRPEVPAALDEILERALKPEPDDRFRSAQEFIDALSLITVHSKPAPSVAYRRRQSWMKWGGVSALVIAGVAAAAPMAMKRFRPTASVVTAPGSDLARVAVLPMEPLTPDSLLGILANGFQTDIIDELAQYPALTVISKNGVVQFRGNASSTDSIARVLNVGSIVTGDIRRNGDTVRVTVRLIDGASGEQRSKADAFGSVRDLLAVRSSVLDSVTSFLRKAIGSEIGAAQRLIVRSAEAWELHARAKELNDVQQGVGTGSSVDQRTRNAVIDSLLQRSAALDELWPVPLNTRALVLLQRATTEDQQALQNPSKSTQLLQSGRELRQQAVASANEALSRSTNNAEALSLRGKARFALWRNATTRADSMRAAAEADLQTAVRRRRDMASAWSDLSVMLQLRGEYAKSRDAAENALKADAFLKNAATVVGQLLFTSLATGLTDEARRWCNRGKSQYPTFPEFWGCDLTILGWTGTTKPDVGRAWNALRAAEARDSSNMLAFGWASRRLFVAAVAARAGYPDSARAIVTAVRAALPDGVPNANVDYAEAYVRTLLGERAAAIPLLQRYLVVNPSWREQLGKHPWFESLRGDATFQALTASR